MFTETEKKHLVAISFLLWPFTEFMVEAGQCRILKTKKKSPNAFAKPHT
jgi:hypothetical protein